MRLVYNLQRSFIGSFRLSQLMNRKGISGIKMHLRRSFETFLWKKFPWLLDYQWSSSIALQSVNVIYIYWLKVQFTLLFTSVRQFEFLLKQKYSCFSAVAGITLLDMRWSHWKVINVRRDGFRSTETGNWHRRLFPFADSVNGRPVRRDKNRLRFPSSCG